MKMELKECSLEDGIDILEMLREIGPGENGFQNYEYNMAENEFMHYLVSSINNSKGIGLEPARVPQTKYWLFADDRPVGMIKLRHYLNENLLKNGGHIGYCIRPTERGKGYGSIMLREVLKKAVDMNIPKVLLTCKESNTASRKVIEKNRGDLERIEEGWCYYWIKLDSDKGIREIHPDDYQEIFYLWERTPGMGLSEADSDVNIRNFLLRNKSLSLCYKDKDQIVATILCGHDGRRGYIYHVTVKPEYRGRGIGSRLVKLSLQKLKEEGIDKCHLFVFADNSMGNAFWSSTGWVRRDDIFVYSRNV